MKQKWLVVLTLVMTTLLVNPLTVSAESSDSSSFELSDDWSDVDDTWGDMSKYGYANDMMIVMSLFDGLEEEFTTIEDMDKMNILSAQLEPGHFYRVTLDFMCNIDESNLEVYEDVSLQVRFPVTLVKGSPNAIGYSVNGSAITTWCDTFGISSDESIDLYFLEDSGKVELMGGRAGDFPSRADDALFASAEGMPIGQLFEESMDDLADIDGYKVNFFQVKFTLYAAPHEGTLHRDDMALNYWAGQELMYAIKTTSAPESYYYTAIMDAEGNISLPSKDVEDKVPWGIILVVSVILVGLIIFLGYKVRKSAHERGITGFMNIFLDFMRLSDEYDDD